MTQAELAKKADTSPGHISALESGLYPNPTVKSLIPIARALGVTVEELFGVKARSRLAPLPIIGKAIASPEGAYYTDQDLPPGGANEYYEIKDENAFVLVVESDSMEPAIRAGDRVIVCPNKKCRPGDICVVRLAASGKTFLKRIDIHGDTVILKSDNPNYPALVHKWKEIEFAYRVEAIIPR